MSKPCSVCSLDQNLQEQIKEMYEQGKTLDQIFALFIESPPEERATSRSSIRRHLIKCLGKNEDLENTQIEQTPLTSFPFIQDIQNEKPQSELLVYNKIQNVFDNSLTLLHRTIACALESDGPEIIDLMKATDVLTHALQTIIQTFQTLYFGKDMPRIKPDELLFTKEQIIKLGAERIEILATLLEAPKETSDQILKEKIIKAIDTKTRQTFPSEESA